MSITHIEEKVWRTAAIVEPHLARRCVGRLADFRIDFQVVRADRQLRILVQRADVDEAINVLADVLARTATLRHHRPPKARTQAMAHLLSASRGGHRRLANR